jgi:hypothetical protein
MLMGGVIRYVVPINRAQPGLLTMKLCMQTIMVLFSPAEALGFYLVNDGGVFTADDVDTWTNITGVMQITQYYRNERRGC